MTAARTMKAGMSIGVLALMMTSTPIMFVLPVFAQQPDARMDVSNLTAFNATDFIAAALNATDFNATIFNATALNMTGANMTAENFCLNNTAHPLCD